MVDTCGQAVSAQMADHDDQVGPHPVGDDWNDDRGSDECCPPLYRAIGKVRVQAPHHERGNEIAQPAASLDNGPAPRRNREEIAFAIDGHAGRTKRGDGKVGGPVDERRHQELADRHCEE